MTIWHPRLDGRKGPLYRAIVDALDEDVANGVLTPGDRLPTHRDLAFRLGVTVGTISRAYAEAARRGLTDGTVGRGTFILAPGRIAATDAECLPEPPRSAPFATGDSNGSHAGRQWQSLQHGGPTNGLDLSLNYPGTAPLGSVLAAGLRGMDDMALLSAVGGYQPANGMRTHRETGASWLYRQGIAVQADDLLVVPGCQGGLSSTLLALCRPGDTVLHEWLSWPGLQATAAPLGVRTLGLAMDADGLLPDAFEAACREHRPKLLYTMPTLHNPTAIVMPEERRRAVAAVAARHQVVVVEDDVYGFLLEDPLPPLRTFLPDLGIYITSLSKCVSPGLRIGWLAAPPTLTARIAAAMRLNVLMASSVAAEIGCRAIVSGAAAVAAEAQRSEARARQRLAAERLHGLEFRSQPTAFHGWLTVPVPWQRDDFVAALRARGVVVTPGSAFAGFPACAAAETHVRLCLCAITERDRLSTALDIVAEVARDGAAGQLPVV